MPKAYGPRTLDSIEAQCEARGVPAEEMDSVLAHIAEREGKRVKEMNEPELRRANRNLADHMESYLDGKKRRQGPADPWGEGTGEVVAGGGGGGPGEPEMGEDEL